MNSFCDVIHEITKRYLHIKTRIMNYKTLNSLTCSVVIENENLIACDRILTQTKAHPHEHPHINTSAFNRTHEHTLLHDTFSDRGDRGS